MWLMPPTQKTCMTRFALGAKCGWPAAMADCRPESHDRASQPNPAPVSKSSLRRVDPGLLDIYKLARIEQTPAENFQTMTLDQRDAGGQFAGLRRTPEGKKKSALYAHCVIRTLFGKALCKSFGLPLHERV